MSVVALPLRGFITGNSARCLLGYPTNNIPIISPYHLGHRLYSTKNNNKSQPQQQKIQPQAIDASLKARLQQKPKQAPTSDNGATSQTAFTSKMQLMRDFMQDSLYNAKYGYFTSKEVITSIDPKDFRDLSSLKNRREYYTYLSDLYRQSQHSWFTPVEIFQPYYSNAIGRYIIETFTKSQTTAGAPLKIFEIGAGSGTNALCILNFLRSQHPELYATTQYTIIEISRLLAEKQLERIKAEHPNIKVQVYNTSIFNWTHRMEEDECFVLMTEVIDNLPHDKILINADGIYETVVLSPQSSQYYEGGDEQQVHIEYQQALSDPVIREFLQLDNQSGMETLGSIEQGKLNRSTSITYLYQSLKNFFQGDRSIVYVPTVCLKMFQILAKFFPRHHLVLADFDFIPSLVKGENAPTVQEKRPIDGTSNNGDYESIDHPNVTVPLGSCDIFFPTNWGDLHRMYVKTNEHRAHFAPNQVKSYKQGDFLKSYIDDDPPWVFNRFEGANEEVKVGEVPLLLLLLLLLVPLLIGLLLF
ncbi:hypothetical protein SAMD00019534_088400 [Acytostelium subglobosum LB1]|uniref:hypothetical protein n=1 Tax=Acytostelium subglobosum LB1 TaxID=1410327 RepID=UPI000644CCD1|nr:hypothetical protein SAMD00019534_088400 [Acytostelium subglobosum LB1]GAM25665.1 hypothetical protein SAMD00019534_088400 [Acytostelium subglobosum LB1]|eukprot:XP_012751183.1 hypothetical protein SAMD00019534_088400 [Acytostelium subglobosum LB1]